MTDKELSYKLADSNEAIWEIDKELKNIELKLLLEDNPDRIQWYKNSKNQLLKEKAQIKKEIYKLSACMEKPRY